MNWSVFKASSISYSAEHERALDVEQVLAGLCMSGGDHNSMKPCGQVTDMPAFSVGSDQGFGTAHPR